ncbi:MAG: phosphate regulon sensor histidine kinase PhoR [Candidatus Accumulibacter sp.]|jgi:two-component system phosphate regulon sensor histidine kinase PhoR|nr:phosphate regulon sensor histidine kinase PhoR [Accumulibacter sp.]
MSGLLARLIRLLFLMGAGAALACLFERSLASVGRGIALGGGVWLIWDTLCFLRFLNWLRLLHEEPDTSLPRLPGLWRDAALRISRLLRRQIRLTRESETRLDNLRAGLQVSPNGIIVLDRQARIEWCNQMACRHFGLDARRDVAQSVTHLLRDPGFVAHLAARDFDHAVTLSGAASTAAHPLRLSVRLCPYGQGRLLLISQDITVFEQAEAMRRDFVANVSHEIRTPLTVLAGFVETLQTLPLAEDERQEYLERMARQAGHMRHLVDDLLTLSRLEEGPPPGLDEWTPLAALLPQIEADARALSAVTTGEGVPQRLAFPGADELARAGKIAGAATELHSALFNLVNNAIRYTPPGGEIEVRWQPLLDGRASFSVRDSGPGIAPEHVPRLTERFYRVDSARSRATGGTGLGLSIVKHVLQRHGAILAIDSVLGQGASFTVTFPADRVRTEDPIIVNVGEP